MTEEQVPAIPNDDSDILAAGYAPKLRRSVRAVASWAASFSMMSILMGVFSNYGYMLTKAGVFGIWTWVAVGIGQTLVALVFADLAGRVSLAGAIYNWNTLLANRFVGWVTGFLIFLTYTVASVGISMAAVTPLQTLLGQEFSALDPHLVGGLFFLLCIGINIVGIGFAARINQIAVLLELGALAVFGATLLCAILHQQSPPFTALVTAPFSSWSGFGGFLPAILLGAWTIFGFEASSELSEETLNVKKVVPRNIISSVVFTALAGFVFVTILSLGIFDLEAARAASDPISLITEGRLKVKCNLLRSMQGARDGQTIPAYQRYGTRTD